ncbi:MAG TPA: hemin uptake protein HemP [Casimicrobiaceae bacterium]|nr:hemin uptake protein HemP [Casimicrobiaceae bacterium]
MNASIASPRVVTSDALLRGESQLAILHDRTVYFLRRTRFGKLILTK